MPYMNPPYRKAEPALATMVESTSANSRVELTACVTSIRRARAAPRPIAELILRARSSVSRRRSRWRGPPGWRIRDEIDCFVRMNFAFLAVNSNGANSGSPSLKHRTSSRLRAPADSIIATMRGSLELDVALLCMRSAWTTALFLATAPGDVRVIAQFEQRLPLVPLA